MASIAPPASAAATRTEVWRGAYSCAQGLTGLTLTLLIQPGGETAGLFEFYAVGANPRVPKGCFDMMGMMDRNHHLTLAPGAWRRHPTGYVTVGLTGDEVDAKRLVGTIAGPGCSTFALVRQTMPGQPSACASVSV
ncbi:hypothetical protein ACELLULO517_24910 [Acidisoma cellulosilytica]|uniref:Uncharacterized protein n=1 Tax=Acidisoma cellulosilyticum TaxID=2802395 RepID=A0A963Z7Y3_9PROT|nr:hypothetical protein [Acidisoma cellulosilyticum]MCB8883512.1 hypothetical protein [Acidisoma cellulosilyticum]